MGQTFDASASSRLLTWAMLNTQKEVTTRRTGTLCTWQVSQQILPHWRSRTGLHHRCVPQRLPMDLGLPLQLAYHHRVTRQRPLPIWVVEVLGVLYRLA